MSLSKTELKMLRESIKRNKRLSKLSRAFDTLPQYSLNVKELYEEVERIHMVRKTRSLNSKKRTFVAEITEGLLDDQSHRSRLSEILLASIHVIRNLEDTLKTMEGYLLIEYSAELTRIRTKSERQFFVQHHVLLKYIKFINRVESLKNSVEIVITDIDKAAWMYRNLIESVKLATDKRESI